MQLTFSLSVLTTLAVLTHAAYVPSQPWSTLTPSGTIDSASASSNYDGSFALSIKTLGKGSTGTSAAPAAPTGGSADETEASAVAGAVASDAAVSVPTAPADIGASAAPVESGATASVPTPASDVGASAPTGEAAALRKRSDIVNQLGDGQIQQGGGSGSDSGSGSDLGSGSGSSGDSVVPGSGSGSGSDSSSEGSGTPGGASGSGSTPGSGSEGSGAPGGASGSGSGVKILVLQVVLQDLAPPQDQELRFWCSRWCFRIWIR